MSAPLLREDFPLLPPGCSSWVLRQRSGSATLFVDDAPTTDWPFLLEFLNRWPQRWQIAANVEDES